MDWVILEVVIGLSFLFFVVSIIASAVNEAISGIFKQRARMLEQGIVNLITGVSKPPPDDTGMAVVRGVYEHSLVRGYGDGTSKPSYLASRSFRNALFDVTGLLEATVQPKGDPLPVAEAAQRVEAAIDSIPSENLKNTLTALWRSAEYDATEFRAAVERWFDRGMERVSGWYKRRTQLMLFILGLAVAALLNANALWVADHLWKDDSVRQALIAQVDVQQETTTGSEAIAKLDEIGFPIGWDESNRADSAGEWAIVLGGWIITGIAVTFGAPFWFDVLGKFSNLRAAGKKPASTIPLPSES
jgi:hypothetical protein